MNPFVKSLVSGGIGDPKEVIWGGGAAGNIDSLTRERILSSPDGEFVVLVHLDSNALSHDEGVSTGVRDDGGLASCMDDRRAE